MKSMEEFKEYLRKRGVSNRTKIEYVKIVNAFMKHANYDVKNYVQDKLEEFILNKRTPSYRFALKHYFKLMKMEAAFERFTDRNKLVLAKQFKHTGLKTVLTLEQVKTLVSYLPEGYTDSASLQYDRALRADSILTAKIPNFAMDEEGDYYVRIITKGDVARTKYLSPRVAKLIKKYIGNRTEGNIFDFNYNAYSYQLSKLGKSLFDLKVNTHTLRRSKAVHMFRRGENIKTVQKELDHASIITTMIYLEEAGIESKELMKKEASIWE